MSDLELDGQITLAHIRCREAGMETEAGVLNNALAEIRMLRRTVRQRDSFITLTGEKLSKIEELVAGKITALEGRMEVVRGKDPTLN